MSPIAISHRSENPLGVMQRAFKAVGMTAALTVDGSTGMPKPLETIGVGEQPMWVLVLGLAG